MLVPGAVVLLAMHIFWHPKYQPPRVIPVNHPTQLETWRHSSWTMYLSAFCLYSRTFHPNKTTSKLGIVDTKIIQNPRKLDTCRSQLRSFERQPYQPSYAPKQLPQQPKTVWWKVTIRECEPRGVELREVVLLELWPPFLSRSAKRFSKIRTCRW